MRPGFQGLAKTLFCRGPRDPLQMFKKPANSPRLRYVSSIRWPSTKCVSRTQSSPSSSKSASSSSSLSPSFSFSCSKTLRFLSREASTRFCEPDEVPRTQDPAAASPFHPHRMQRAPRSSSVGESITDHRASDRVPSGLLRPTSLRPHLTSIQSPPCIFKNSENRLRRDPGMRCAA